MFRTKLEVDKHVDNSLKKINSETERNLRCFSFAKLYFNVGEYEQACRYVSSYLSVKPKSPEGHNLLGKALEKLGKKQAALEEYRTSLQLDPKQNNVVLKVCELLASDDIDMDKAGAKYFCDLGQQLDPHNPAVLGLREKLITSDDKDPTEISQMLLKELECRPTDVNLRVRLLKHFLQNNMVKEAYKHASDIEEKNLTIFHNNISWYETVTEVLVRYQRDLSYSSQLTWEFWFLSVSVMNKLVALSLDEHIEIVKTTTDVINNTFNFDQMLSKATQNISSCPDRTLVQVFLNHYNAQLNFHFATLLFKQAKKDLISFKEASNISLPLLLSAYHTSPPEIQNMWYNDLPENRRKLLNHWHKEASYRCSQTGHILLGAAKEKRSIILEKASQFSTGMWRENVFKKLFVKRDQQLKMNTSYFLTSTNSTEPTIKLPEMADVIIYDEVAQFVHPDSLHDHIWIAMNSKLSDYCVKCFEGLQYSIKNLTNCSAEGLNVLDIQSFIYLSTLCAQNKREENRTMRYFNQDKPSVLPAAITETLGTLNQSKFITSAYKMYKNEHTSNMGEVRLLLIKGIEVVRCVGQHGLEVKLLITLANIFAERAKILTKQSEIEANDARAELYWKTALPLLEKLKNNQHLTYPSLRMFEYKSKEMSPSEINMHIEQGKLFLGQQLMKKKEYEKALHLFESLRDPYASFYLAQIYKHMADQKTSQNKENVTSEMRSQHIILLSKSRDCLYLTLDRLREPSTPRDHPLNVQLGTEIEKIERLLSRIDPDCNNRHECEGMSDENVSSDNSGEHYLTTYNTTSFTNGHHYTSKQEVNNHSTPLRFNVTRQEARPSPERLDAQLRQIVAARDMSMNNILEQNRMMLDSHKSLLEELRSFKDAVNHLTSTVEDLKSMKSGLEEIKQVKESVEELKNSVDEVRNVVDVVQELKKEIHELKKEKDTNAQLSEEDLYVLDPDNLQLDYGLNQNVPGTAQGLGASLYPHYPQQHTRLPNTATSLAAAYGAAAGLYPGLYPGLAYAYGGLGLPPAAPPLQLLPEQQMIPPQQPLTFNQPSTYSLTGQSLTQTSTMSKDVPKPSIATTGITQSLFSPVVSVQASINTTTIKQPPVNVVITASDPLPTNKISTSQPILSVTIPPQHIKSSLNKPVPTQPNQPHNYQITLTTTTTVTTPSVLTMSGMSLSKSPKNVALGQQIEKTLEQTFNTSKDTSNVSASSVEEHDAMPDFKPIIPLPDEVPVNTGEENETQLFCERAKLFRHVNKEWKERGVGNIKILHNPDTGKVRILMRREQIHKICANHFLTKDTTISPMSNNDRAYIWAAHDFADEETVLEKFCVRFKTADEAKKFYDAFEHAKKLISDQPNKTSNVPTPKINIVPKKTGSPDQQKKSEANLGGFVFTSTPTFKPKEVETVKPVEAKKEETTTSSPFANFTFGSSISKPQPKTNLFSSVTSESKPSEATTFSPLVISAQKDHDDSESHAEDFVPTAEFKPVVSLPDLIEVKTGEENAEVLFEERAKLFRYDTNGENKEWKERGVGIVKILKEDTIRLLMRREQVHKVCCNHQVLKNMTFKQNSTKPQAIIWHAQDFSEGVLKPETFTLRFKTEEQATRFLKTIQSAQASLNDDNQISTKHHKAEPSPPSPKTGFGDKFKPAKGSWECKNCLIVNEGKTNKCVACDSSKPGSSAIATDESGAKFSFGVATDSKSDSGFSFNAKAALDWGNAFKPAEGSWECKSCFVRNPADKTKCAACEASKDGVSAASEPQSTPKGINLDTPGQKFSFGIPFAKKETTLPQGFGEAFKPKPGSWECKACYTRNDGDKLYCMSCENPKDDSVPQKEKSKGVNLDTPGQKFVFGIPSSNAGAGDAPKTFTFGDKSGTPLSFAPKSVLPANGVSTEPSETKEDTKFVFGSPQKHEFEFKPRSPRKISTNQGEESDNSYYVDEEEDNIYFKPVIPLPDKVEVKTGEEEEDVLYCHRAKLFRFVGGEWKERGLGDIKILKQRFTDKLRVVMRREQVHKICLNHWLTKDIEYRLKDDRTWLFSAPDFSEGSISRDQFCLRFKNDEIAQSFKKAIDDALGQASTGKKAGPGTPDDEVEVVFETKVTPEEEREAIRLGLPPKFFAYKQLPDCTCEQCKKDDEYLKELFAPGSKKSSTADSTGLSFGTPTSNASSLSSTFFTPTSLNSITTTSKPEDTPKDLSKATPKTADTPPAFTFGKTDTSKSQSLRDLIKAPSMLTTTTTNVETTRSTFSFTGTTTTPGSIFGGGSQNNATQKVFGTQGAIFGNVKPSSVFSNTTTTGASASTPTTASTTSNLFANVTPTTTNNLFSSVAATTSSIFSNSGTPTTNLFTNSLFSNSSTTSLYGGTPKTSESLFSGTPTSPASSPSIFGGTAPSSGIFGSAANSPATQTTSSSIFTATTVPQGLFTGTGALFGAATTNVFSAPKPIGSFTGSATLFGNAVGNTGGSLFGNAVGNTGSLFGGGTTIFGNKIDAKPTEATLTFGNLGKEATESAKLRETDEVVLKSDPGLSFAALAAQSPQPAFVKTNDDDKQPFAALGAGAPVFGSQKVVGKKNDKANKSKTESDNEENDDGGQEHDPHFEPIIPLPDEVVVSTGEENEEVLFNERAKLFRFDANNKEWKERGVGQMKILHHPQNDTYRLLLRREQVHKVVLNQLIQHDLELQRMPMSEQAWIWAGYNFTDDAYNLEKLAVKFKNMELANTFKQKVEEVLAKVKTKQMLQQPNVEVEEISDEQTEGEDGEGEETDEEEEDERSIMFEKRCTLSEQLPDGTWKKVTMGNLQVYYDPELYAAKIAVTDDKGMVHSNTLIGMNTLMDINKNECTWRAVEWANADMRWRNLKATFSSNVAAQEFHSNYLEGINYANEVAIIDEMPNDPGEPED